MSDNQEHNEDSHQGEEPPVRPGEYRIIPADKSAEASEDYTVNIPGLIAALRDRLKLIAIITCCCLVAGILYGLSATVEYQSRAEVLPEINNSPRSGVGQLIQNYGGLLGISGFGSNKVANNQYVSPNIYPIIVHSLSFQTAILQDTVYFAGIDSSMTLYQYFSGEKGSFDNSGQIGAKVDLKNILDASDISSLTKQQMGAVNAMRQRVDIKFENGTGVMKVKVIMPDAVAAAQVCSQVIERLKKVVKKYHTRKARHLLEYAKAQYQKAKEKFLKAQHKLATFKDNHSNLVTATAQSRLKYLRSKYNLAYSVYNSAAQRRIAARTNFQRSIPVFNIIQPPNVPLHPYSPRWIPIILISIAVGLVMSFLVIAGWFVYQQQDVY